MIWIERKDGYYAVGEHSNEIRFRVHIDDMIHVTDVLTVDQAVAMRSALDEAIAACLAVAIERMELLVQ